MNIHGSEVNNVYPVASFNDSKTDKVLKTVFALKDDIKKIKCPRRVLNPGPCVD